jgi:hypothetical protein
MNAAHAHGHLPVICIPAIIVVRVFIVDAVKAELFLYISAVSTEFISARLAFCDVIGFFSTTITYWHL